MPDTEFLALIHGEIDGELDARQRADLARRLLSDPEARALREELRSLCSALDAVRDVEPPTSLSTKILNALPRPAERPARAPWAAPRWRYAALVAGLCAGGAVVFETLQGPGPAITEVAGTMAASRATATLDSVRLSEGPVTGRVSLYRDAAGIGVAFELAAEHPVDALITGAGPPRRVPDVGRTAGPAGAAAEVPLTFWAADQRVVTVTLLMAGRPVGSAMLHVPADP
jgi:hypothetical protein